MYLVGKVLKTHGIKGELKIANYSDFNRFVKGKKVIIANKEYIINTVRAQNDILLVSFLGFDNINDVIVLRGESIYSDEPIKKDALDVDEYHIPALIGREVYDQNDQLIGKVIFVIEVVNNHLLEILQTNGKKALIPFVGEFVKSITDEKIVVNVIEGLL